MRVRVRFTVGVAAFTISAAGCSLIVTSDVPNFACASTSASACPSGMSCDVQAGHCVSGAIVPDEDAGDDDAETVDGDAKADTDVVTGPADLGSACRVDGDCKSRLCGTSTHLTTVITQATGPICTTPCCTTIDCPASFVCFNGGTGGGYCVPATLAQRKPPASGGKAAGATCSGDTDCRSGLCQESRCVDTCCSPTDCAPGSECRVKTVSLLKAATPTHDVWVCAPPIGTLAYGDSCNSQDSCKSDVCLPSAGGFCRPPCSNTASCAKVGYPGGHCLYTGGPDFIHFCLFNTNGSDLPTGATCNLDGECQSDFCDPESKKCANVCSRNADCGPGEECRPSAIGTPFLRCMAKR